MRKIFLTISVLVGVFLIWEFVPHTHLLMNSKDVSQISITASSGEKLTLNKEIDIRVLGFLIKNVKLYESDLSALPASPEKFVNVSLDDSSIISVNNTGGYSLVIHKKANTVSSAKVYRTNLFWIDFIYWVANILNRIT